MSVFGLSKKQDFFPLFADEWNTVLDAIDQIYLNKLNLESKLLSGTGDFYVRSLLSSDDIYAFGLVFSEGKRVLRDLDPIYLAGFINSASKDIEYFKQTQAQIQSSLLEIYYTQKSIEQKVDEIRLYASPRAVESLILPIDTTPKPIKPIPTPVKKIKIFITTDTTYVAYIGDASAQEFPIMPNEKEEIEIDDAMKLYIRSENYGYARLLLLKTQ